MGKLITLIIASKDFRDEEYFIPKEVFEKEGFKVETVSDKRGVSIGVYGGEAKAELSLKEVEAERSGAIVFVGGPGALKFLDNEHSYKIVNKAKDEGKVLGGICVSPVILANSGAIEGKEATVYSSSMEKTPVKTLKEKGVFYKEKELVVDNKVVTANGPEAAEEFARAIIKLMKDSGS